MGGQGIGGSSILSMLNARQAHAKHPSFVKEKRI